MRVLRGNAVVTEPSPLQTRGQRSKDSSKKKKKGKKEEAKEEEGEEEEEKETAMGLIDVGRITGLYADALENFTMHRSVG